NTLAAVTPSETIRLFDVGSGRQLAELGEETVPYWAPWCHRLVFDVPGDNPVRLAWSPDSKRIAQGWGPGMVRIWDAETGKGNDSGLAHFGRISGLIVSRDGKSAVTLGQDNTVRTWTVPRATERRRVSLPPDTMFGELLGAGRALLHTKEAGASVWDI